MVKIKRGRGRPTKLTQTRIKEISQFIEKGLDYKTACLLSNISESVFHLWKKRGEEARENKKENIYLDLLESIAQSEAKYKKWLLDKVNDSSEKDGKLALEILARRWPAEYGKKDYLKLQGDFNIDTYDVPPTKKEMEEAGEQLKLFLRGEDE